MQGIFEFVGELFFRLIAEIILEGIFRTIFGKKSNNTSMRTIVFGNHPSTPPNNNQQNNKIEKLQEEVDEMKKAMVIIKQDHEAHKNTQGKRV